MICFKNWLNSFVTETNSFHDHHNSHDWDEIFNLSNKIFILFKSIHWPQTMATAALNFKQFFAPSHTILLKEFLQKKISPE